MVAKWLPNTNLTFYMIPGGVFFSSHPLTGYVSRVFLKLGIAWCSFPNELLSLRIHLKWESLSGTNSCISCQLRYKAAQPCCLLGCSALVFPCPYLVKNEMEALPNLWRTFKAVGFNCLQCTIEHRKQSALCHSFRSIGQQFCGSLVKNDALLACTCSKPGTSPESLQLFIRIDQKDPANLFSGAVPT